VKRIYSDLTGHQMTSEMGSVEVHLIDEHGSYYRPNLIIPNMLALKKLRDYCNEVLEEHSSYFKENNENDQQNT